MVRSRESFNYCWAPTISATAEARVIEFCTPIGHIKSQHMADKSPLKRAWSRSCYPF